MEAVYNKEHISHFRPGSANTALGHPVFPPDVHDSGAGEGGPGDGGDLYGGGNQYAGDKSEFDDDWNAARDGDKESWGGNGDGDDKDVDTQDKGVHLSTNFFLLLMHCIFCISLKPAVLW